MKYQLQQTKSRKNQKKSRLKYRNFLKTDTTFFIDFNEVMIHGEKENSGNNSGIK